MAQKNKFFDNSHGRLEVSRKLTYTSYMRYFDKGKIDHVVAEILVVLVCAAE